MIPPRYTLFPSAVLRMAGIPIQLRWTYLVLYALAWRHDYRYVAESLAEMAEIFSELEGERVTFRMMRYRMKGLSAHGLIERKRMGRRYRTHLLVRHDSLSKEQTGPPVVVDAETEVAADLPRYRPGRVSNLDRMAYELLDDLGVDYVRQYHPPGCPYWFDIFLPGSGLLVELDSQYWHRGPEAERKGTIDRDRRKDAWAKKHGYDIVRLKVGDIRDESERIRLERNIEQIIQERHLLSVEKQRGDNYVSPSSPLSPPNINSTVVVDDISLDDQERQQQQYSNRGDVELFEENEELLGAMGVIGDVRRRLAREPWVTPEYLEGVMAYVAEQAARGNRLGPGWVVVHVGSGEPVPDSDGEELDGDRYIRGKYKDYIQW